MDNISKITCFIIDYFDQNGRRFSWRKNKTPFTVYLSEILLQRTRAEQAEVVFCKLIKRYENVYLFFNNFDEARQLMVSLGRFVRLNYIQKGLQYLIEQHKGEFPVEFNDLIKIPSIGPYIAAAIRVFGFRLHDVIIDSNVVRVLGRLHGLDVNPETRRRKAFYDLASKHVPEYHYIEYSYGILDFAAKICKPISPECHLCGLQTLCKSMKCCNVF